MDVPEPMIADYDVCTWMNSTYTGRDMDKMCLPDTLSKRYRGLVRVSSAISSGDDFSSEED